MATPFVYDWKIRGYPKLCTEKQSVTSPVFAFEGHEWQILLDLAANPDHVGIRLQWIPKSGCRAAPSLRFSFAMINPEDATKSFGCIQNAIIKFSSSHLNHGWDNFCSKSMLSGSFIDPIGESIRLKVLISSDPKINLDALGNDSNVCYRSEPIQKPAIDVLSRLYKSGYMTDLVVYVADEPFHCHKAILSAVSTVLRSEVLKHLDSCEIELPDINPTVFKLLLGYIYGKQIRIIGNASATADQLLHELLITAHALKIDGVGLQICINDHNSCILLNAAIANKDDALIEHCLSFIIRSSQEHGRMRICKPDLSLDGFILIVNRVIQTYAGFLAEPRSVVKTWRCDDLAELLVSTMILHIVERIINHDSPTDVVDSLIQLGKPLFNRLDMAAEMEKVFENDAMLPKVMEISVKIREAVKSVSL